MYKSNHIYLTHDSFMASTQNFHFLTLPISDLDEEKKLT